MPRQLAAHGTPGGTVRPSVDLRCRLPADLDAALRRFANTHRLGLGQVIAWAVDDYLRGEPARCGCTRHLPSTGAER